MSCFLWRFSKLFSIGKHFKAQTSTVKEKEDKKMYLPKRGKIWNHLKPAKMTWNHPETIWNLLKPPRNKLKPPETSHITVLYQHILIVILWLFLTLIALDLLCFFGKCSSITVRLVLQRHQYHINIKRRAIIHDTNEIKFWRNSIIS